MATSVPKSIGEALDAVTEDDFKDDAADDTAEEADTTVPAEPAAEEGEGETEAEGEGEAESGEGEAEGETKEEGEAEPAEADDVFDQLTAEQLAAIKADPGLNALRKSLLRGYSEKTAGLSQLVQLSQEYARNPRGVIQALAESQGLTLAEAKKQAEAATAVAGAAAAADPGQELESLFGPQIGPKVRAVFEKWLDVRTGTKLAPVEQTLGTITRTSEQARMLNEEQAFKARHKDITPDIEKAIVELGNSGKIVPGDMTPSEYLDTLYDVTMARFAREKAKKAAGTASTKLAKKIESNRKDREPSGIGSKAPVQKVSRVAEAKNISDALDIAMEELEAEGR